MTRRALFCGLVLALGMTATAQEKKDETKGEKKEMPKDLVPFQGTWKVVKAEFGGIPPGDGAPELRFRFAGDKVVVREGKGDDETGSYSVDAMKDPGELDLVNTKGVRLQGIYKFDKDGKLTLCFVGDKGDRPKSFDTRKTSAGMMVLEKVKD